MMNSSLFVQGLTKLDHSVLVVTQEPFLARILIGPLLYGTPFNDITETQKKSIPSITAW